MWNEDVSRLRSERSLTVAMAALLTATFSCGHVHPYNRATWLSTTFGLLPVLVRYEYIYFFQLTFICIHVVGELRVAEKPTTHTEHIHTHAMRIAQKFRAGWWRRAANEYG